MHRDFAMTLPPVLLATFAVACPSIALAASCTLSLSGMTFGAYDVLTPTALDTTSTINVACTRTVSPNERVNYTLTASVGSGASYASRSMAQGVERLNYNLYRNAARSQIWGNGTGGSQTITGTHNLSNGSPTRNRNHTLYGRIPALQNVAAGNYLDTLAITLIF
ncbi:MAG: spore coat U domain-containing protein [Thiobacillus sp.]